MWSWFFYFYWKLEVYKTTQLAELSSNIHTKCWTEICLICSPVYHLLAFLCWSFPVGNYCWQFSFTPINSGLLEQHRVREAQVLFGSSLDWRKKCTSLLSLHLQGGQGVDDSFLYLAVFRNVLWSAVALDKTFLWWSWFEFPVSEVQCCVQVLILPFDKKTLCSVSLRGRTSGH